MNELIVRALTSEHLDDYILFRCARWRRSIALVASTVYGGQEVNCRLPRDQCDDVFQTSVIARTAVDLPVDEDERRAGILILFPSSA
ncbi:MAG: hypothetical protein U0V48_01585 [Anaerolineales bacterium]